MLTRARDEDDRRGVRITLTEPGWQTKQQHEAFHRELTDEILSSINEEEAKALIRSLDISRTFFAKKKSVSKKAQSKLSRTAPATSVRRKWKRLEFRLFL